MNTSDIYNVLLDQPRQIDGKTWHGFSYQLSRDESGKIEVREHGWPTKLTIYEADGPELDALDEATVKAAIESALPVDEGYVIPPPPTPYVEAFTPEAWVTKHLTSLQILSLQRLEMALLTAGQTLGSNMTALKGWLESMMLASVDPTPRTFDLPPCSYETASSEAVAVLSNPNPEP
jgi:hypothetical protein